MRERKEVARVDSCLVTDSKNRVKETVTDCILVGMDTVRNHQVPTFQGKIRHIRVADFRSTCREEDKTPGVYRIPFPTLDSRLSRTDIVE
jgi:hypothetical protein